MPATFRAGRRAALLGAGLSASFLLVTSAAPPVGPLSAARAPLASGAAGIRQSGVVHDDHRPMSGALRTQASAQHTAADAERKQTAQEAARLRAAAAEQRASRKAAAERAAAAEQRASRKASADRAARARRAQLRQASWVAPVRGYHLGASYGLGGGLWAHRHSGQDFVVPSGTAVLAVHDGTVVEAGWGGAYGWNIVIRHSSGVYTQYAHLSRLGVRTGQRVGTGQVIGRSGSTGNSTGPHLHFEARTAPWYGSSIAPLQFLRSRGARL
ncbi:M23 family metallopeptidase [Streptomyces sp. NPDC057271]|uniref:M23 family metallopeptidase n=1 Tax=unclassified Streptomyces TaxID=2593676 RepID=UPI0036457B1B